MKDWIDLRYFLENVEKLQWDRMMDDDWGRIKVNRKALTADLAKFVVSLKMEESMVPWITYEAKNVRDVGSWLLDSILDDEGVSKENFPRKKFMSFCETPDEDLQKLIDKIRGDRDKIRDWLRETFIGILFLPGGLKRKKEDEGRID